jgi:hypothetical protein
MQTRLRSLKDFLDGDGDGDGNSFKLAAKAKVRKDSTAPTVYEVVVRHVDLLRKPQPGTIAKNRNMAARISPRATWAARRWTNLTRPR